MSFFGFLPQRSEYLPLRLAPGLARHLEVFRRPARARAARDRDDEPQYCSIQQPPRGKLGRRARFPLSSWWPWIYTYILRLWWCTFSLPRRECTWARRHGAAPRDPRGCGGAMPRDSPRVQHSCSGRGQPAARPRGPGLSPLRHVRAVRRRSEHLGRAARRPPGARAVTHGLCAARTRRAAREAVARSV